MGFFSSIARITSPLPWLYDAIKPSDPPKPPQLKKFIDKNKFTSFVNEITGTKTQEITRPDGSKVIKTISLPMDDQEREISNLGLQALIGSMQNLHQLQQQDPFAVLEYEPLIQTLSNIDDDRIDALQNLQNMSNQRQNINRRFNQVSNDISQERVDEIGNITNLGNIREYIQDIKNMNNQIMDYNYHIANNKLENNLIQRGHYNSFAGDSARAVFEREQALGRMKGNMEIDKYAQDLADQQLARNTKAYDLNELGRQGRLLDASNEMVQHDQQYKDALDHYVLQEKQREIAEQNAMNEYGLQNYQQQQRNQNYGSRFSVNQHLAQMGDALRNNNLNRRLNDRTVNQALNYNQAQYNNRLNTHKLNTNISQANYGNQRQYREDQPMSFGQALFSVGSTVGGAVAGGMMGGGAGSSIGANAGSQMSNNLMRRGRRQQ